SKQEENVLLFGVTADSFLVPNIIEGSNFKNNNYVVADATLKDKGVHVGDQLTLSQSDEKLKIVGFSESAKYNDSLVLFSNNKTIQIITPTHINYKINVIVVKDSNWANKNINEELELIYIDMFVENIPDYQV